jgi:hypothetical protein
MHICKSMHTAATIVLRCKPSHIGGIRTQTFGSLDVIQVDPLGNCCLWAAFLNGIISPCFWTTLIHGKYYVLILTKMDWATFWAMFSQTHLVTLFMATAPRRQAKSIHRYVYSQCLSVIQA